MLTFGSLFAGIGGFDLGFEQAGMRCLWQVEIDPFCQRVLAKHWPNVERFADVKECGTHNLKSVDVICGGFPCQDISYAGKGAGIDGTRSGLWSEFARIIGALRPQYAVLENVAALLNRGMGRVLGDLAACGYDAEWQCLPASAFGAPHGRDRVFIVAYSQVYRSYNETQEAVFGSSFRDTFSRVGSGGSPLRRQPHTLQAVAWNTGTWGDHGKEHTQSPMVGMANGIPHWVDQLRALGNAVVPQVAEWLGRRILEAEAGI